MTQGAVPKAKQHCFGHHLFTAFMKSRLTLSERDVHYERESEKGLTCGNIEAFAARNSWPTYAPRCLTNQPHIMLMSKALAYRRHNAAKAPQIEQLESVAR